MPRFDSPVRVVCDHYRYRLADPDGVSCKWAVDAIVRAGVLADDSAKEIAEITNRQHRIPKTETERTVLTIEEVVAYG